MSEGLQNICELLLPSQLRDLLNYVDLLLAYFNVLSSSMVVLSSPWKERSSSVLLICLVPWEIAENIASCSLLVVHLWQASEVYKDDVSLRHTSLSSI